MGGAHTIYTLGFAKPLNSRSSMEALVALMVFKKLMKRGVFVTSLGVSYIDTFTNMYIVVFFLMIWGLFIKLP